MTDYERGVEQASAIYKEVIREYVAENAKLRELCERCAIELYVNGNVEDAATENLFDDMRELGIEVD